MGPSRFSKSQGTVSAAFVEMHDQQAIGGAIFYAGTFSSDISGNSGWIFGTGPGYVFGLPDENYICPGDTLNISTYNFIGGVSFEWQDGTFSSQYPASQPGTYTVNVTYADRCFLTDTLKLFFNQPASASLNADTSVCPGSNVLLTATGATDATFLWSTGDTTANLLVHPLQTTTYTVTASNVCGMATDEVIITTYPLPTAEAGQDTAICPGTSITLTASGIPGSSFQWNVSGLGPQAIVSPTVSGSYTVTVSDPQQCGTNTDAVYVTVYPTAFADAGPDTTICAGQRIALNAQGLLGSIWLWSTGSTHGSTLVQPLQDATYTVTATDSHHCGTASDTIVVHVTQLPSVWAGSDTTTCPGSPLQASNQCGSVSDDIVVSMYPLPVITSLIVDEACGRADGSIVVFGANAYLWSNGATTEEITQLPAGTYTVTASNTWCSLPQTFTVTEIPGPVAAFTANADFLYEGQNFIFTDASENAIDWTWDFGDNLSAQGEPMVSHLYRQTGEYEVSLAVRDERGCTDTARLKVTMEYPDLFYMPNAFTPNDDGLNDNFGPSWRLPERISNYSLSIYNRWGEEIFITHDLQAGWNGTKGQAVAPDGVYTWLIHLTEAQGLSKQYTGQVVLLQ
jgi:gliding motility-associated-like protein